MIATLIRSALALAVMASVAACEDTEKLQALQKQADEGIAEARREATAQVAKLRTEMAALKVAYDQASTQAKAAAEAAIEEARRDADAHAREAEKALARAREAYKAEGRAKLAAINEDAREVRAKMAKAKGRAKSKVEQALKEADGLQKDIGKDLAAFDKASLKEFHALKAKLGAHLAKLKAKIANAAGKLPKD